MNTRRNARIFGCTIRLSVISIVLAVAGPANAQTIDEAGITDISPAMVESRIEQIETSSAYEETTRDTALDFYRRALVSLKAATANNESATTFQQAMIDAPGETERLRSIIATKRDSEPVADLTVDKNSAAREIEELLQQERTNEAAARGQLTELEQKLANEASRPQAARLRVSQVEEELRAVMSRLSLPPAADEPNIVHEARRWAEQSAAAALRAEMRLLDQELLSQPVRVLQLQARLDDAAMHLNHVQARIGAIQTLLSERRRDDTEKILAKLDLKSLGEAAAHPLVEQILRESEELADELQKLSGTIQELTKSNEAATLELEETRQRYQSAQERVQIAGIGQALGQYMAQERRQLPPLSDYRRESQLREVQIADGSMRNIHFRDRLRDIRDVDRHVETQLEPIPDELAQVLRPALLQLAESQSGLLQQAISLNSNYVRQLADSEHTHGQLYDVISEYRDFLQEHLMWVRSRDVFGVSDFIALPGQVMEIFSPQRWSNAATVFLDRLTRSPLQIAVVLLLLLFQWRKRNLRVRLMETSSKVNKPSEDSFASTVKAVALTLLMTLPWPAFTAVTGYELTDSSQANEATRSIGAGLLFIAPMLFILLAFRLLCTSGGVAEGHFRWAADGVKMLRRQLDILLWAVLVPAFVLIVSREFDDSAIRSGLSQIMLLVLSGGLTIFLHRLLRPHTGMAQALRRRPNTASVISFPWLWIATATLIPLAVGIMSLAGFMYSAGTLLIKLLNTVWLLLGLAVARELIFRWLLVIKRRLLLREALQRREAARAAREASDGAPTTGDEYSDIAENAEEDVASLDADTRKLVNVALVIATLLGVAGIWSSMVPALGIFKDVTMWHYATNVGGLDVLQPVTLIDLLVAGIVVVVTIVAATNIPSLIEIILRQKPTIKPGSRLAFATLARYAIAVVGIGVTLNIVGVNWSKLQWLIAALGVGIGFGLQEIVANFISGLIILIERPIRVGDVVTVGDISGVVSRVQIRATTIRTWDRQELLVPNKEFITGRVLNWSLSDEIVRLHFMVGIAYSSDVEKALQLIEEAAIEHSSVLDDPPPLATFEEFGDNSLNLGLRCFVPTLEIRLQTLTDLHRAINQKFNEAGIVIAFPQRDLHLDTNSPLEIRVLQGASQHRGED